MRTAILAAFTICTICAECSISHAQGAIRKRRIEIEVLTDGNAPIDAAQQWLQVLKRLDIDQVRIRSRRATDDAPSLQGDRPGSSTVKVIAVLTSDNKLVIPNGSYRRNDVSRMAKWIKTLRTPDGGQSKTGAEKGPKATPAELIRLRRMMSDPVTESTKNNSISSFLDMFAGETVPISVERSVRIPQADEIQQELRGLSRGTALAIVARQFGAEVKPESGQPALTIVSRGTESQVWPIGWKPERVPSLVPKLMDSLQVEVKDTPLTEVLAAIQAKVAIPFVVDEFELARRRIDIAKINVKIRPKRVRYKKVLDGILVPNLLQGQVRVDEAGKPFYWITTLKRK